MNEIHHAASKLSSETEIPLQGPRNAGKFVLRDRCIQNARKSPNHFEGLSYNLICQLVVDKIMPYGFTVGSVQNIKLRKTWTLLEMAKEGLVRNQIL
ncbi:hypothetical protein L195_g039883 [Trifolium pratense]|uniref:Uncharacterized protein n=1 Tax=Trifolium pratense TaxID=57577 RepID=A0A2K3LZ80_TRIPR|nr:hypothetical protein L195_g039883 [Trifolium pratense]